MNRFLRPIVRVFSVTVLIAFTGCGGQGGGGGDAENFPTKTVTIICPWAAGGGTDRVSRFFADQLESQLGKPGVVVNRTGGGGAVGHNAGATARPDGHTVLMATFELSTMHSMGISPLTFDDFTPVIQVNADPAAVIVRADAPWKSLSEFLDHVRANRGETRMSGTAAGGAWDLARAGLMLAAGLKVPDVIWVPTDGSAPSLVELLGGHIDAVCCSLPEAASQIASGQLRPLAVMSQERVADHPDVPTAVESGVDWVAVGWRGLMVPKKTPSTVVAKLSSALQTIVDSQEYREFMEKNGFGITVRTGGEFEQFLAAQDSQWAGVIKEAGFAKK